ncbi:sulfurtransferase [Reinekea sp.]|jgi:thiosulfate/3-mercaptopyruvate sulfurtransferase|uniref:sulfurtransferase n=1 Tax=Reinekea sp. TaxID=1970455 RepID=UPI003989BBBC
MLKKTTLIIALTASSLTFAADALVNADWLANNSDVAILDIRSLDAYMAGHIPGALSTPYAEGWRATVNGVSGQLPHLPVIEQKIAALGIDATSHVVIVTSGTSASDYSAASRVYWTFKVLGHEEVSILDGGTKAWQMGDYTISTSYQTPTTGEFSASMQSDILATTEFLKDRLETVQTIDSRSADYFDGTEKFSGARVAGTLPGSANLNSGTVFTGTDVLYFKKNAELEELANTAGVDLNASYTATFCNTGHLGATNWFVLSELLEVPNVALYDGSIVEWTADADRPVQTAKRGLGKLFGWL